MASVEQIREFSSLGREMGLSGCELSSFVSERCQAIEAELKATREADREREALEKAREHEIKLAQLRIEEGTANVGRPQLAGLKLKVGRFDDAHDKFDAYVTKFEMLMKSQNIPVDMWVLYLISNLTGKALDVVNRMSADDRQNYATVKHELMSYYHLTEEGYRRSFRSAKPMKFERPKQFATRMKGYFDHWVEEAEIGDTRKDLEDLILQEQFLIDCPREVVRFVKERKCKDFNEVVDCAEIYVEAHGPHAFSGVQKSERNRPDSKPESKPPQQNQVKRTSTPAYQKPADAQSKAGKTMGNRTFQGRGCYMCGNPNHMRRDCPMLSRPASAQGLMGAGEGTAPKVDMNVANEVSRGDSKPGVVGSTAGCFPIERVVDDFEDVKMKVVDRGQMAYNDVAAMVNRMPVVSGRLMPDNTPVSVLRDTGCSTCVVKEKLVRNDQLTGQHQAVRLIDGTVRHFPVAKVAVDSPYFEGEVEAVCMPDCLSEVVIGNVEGAREPSDPNLHWVPKSVVSDPDVEVITPDVDLESSNDGVEQDVEVAFPGELDDTGMAVQTRAQKVKDSRPSRGLTVADPVDNVRSSEFLREQKDDESLRPLWQKIGQVDNSKYKFFDYDYVVDVEGVAKTYHINLLKSRYYSRREEVPVASCFEVERVEGNEEVVEVMADEEDVAEAGSDWNREMPSMPSVVQMEFVDMVTVDPTTISECEISLTTDQPVRSPPHRVPQAMEEEISKEVDSMLKLGVIEPSNSPYGHPIVIVKKPDGSNRFCVDFRRLNKVTVFDPEPMPNPQELFASLADSRYFTKLDLTKGYWQIPMRNEDKAKTAFITPKGQYQFKYMPFGLVTASAQFTRMMRKVLDGMSNVVNYIDDILIHTDTWQEHVEVLDEVLHRLRDANLAARPSKCTVGSRTIEFLGHKLGEGVIHTSDRLTDKVRKAPRPKTKRQVRSFLGLCGYYRDYIPNYADVALPLTNLTRKGRPGDVVWGPEEESAFVKLKECLANPPVLRLPDFEKTFMLKVDASDSGLGAVLMQEHDGDEFPLAYASKKLLPREQRYSTVEKECLAIVWAVRKFDYYLFGRVFEIHTDHKPLTYLQTKKSTNKRIMRWSMCLQEYRFRLVSIKGSENRAADLMSRLL
ncbi:LOW QUALITY PROTEIN: uncharacterized protein [Diadema setosum]|uniref:LOW QUALITY PROTEIN: uncharacterized protein n=1 Tax=Diadema setosum TaxID=31175 RepID=UPI003B3A5C2B